MTTEEQLGIERAEQAGANAALHGRSYGSNPFPRDFSPRLHLAWSNGHNGMRVRMALDREKGLLA
jgi:ribosome modulation factor